MQGAAAISVTTGTGGTSGAGGSIGDGNLAVDCNLTQQLSTQTIWLLVDQDADSAFEFGASKQIPIDLTAPPALATPVVQGGNEALVASWTALTPTDDASGILGYQMICSRAGQFQVFPSGSYKPGYETAATNCSDKHPGGGTIESLDPNFLCSGLLSASATSARIKVLQNNIVYLVSVLAIDKHLNASLSLPINGTPIPSQNFFNKYRNADTSKPGEVPDGGDDPGGFCSVDPTTTLPLSTLSALGMAGLTVVVLRRRRRRRGE
jgi:MYXO-CTERM domain-containing protein